MIAAIALCMLAALSIPAQAQYRRGNRNRGYAKAEVERIIRRVETQSDRFVQSFDSSLDNSRLDGTRREDNLNQRARDLETDLDSLRQQFDRTDRYQDTRSQVSRVLSTAEGINGVVRRRRLGGNTERLWSQLRTELNALASVYNLRLLR
jgi:histidinol dehydrogenase